MKYSLQKRISAFVLAFALVMTTAFNSVGVTTANAAALKCKSLKANKSSVSVVEGSSVKVTVTQKFNKKSKAKISVSSSNKSVATVSKKLGKKAKSAKATLTIKGVAEGTATITVKSTKKTKKTKKITVTVKAKETATTAAPATTQASANATTETPATTDQPSTTEAPAGSVSLSTNTPKVGDVLVASFKAASGNAKSYAWSTADSATGTFTVISGEATEKLNVTAALKGKFIKVTVTDADGKTYEATTTAGVAADSSAAVSIADSFGLQDDGTGVVGDVLEIVFGADFGTPTAISWYKDGRVISSKTKDTNITELLSLEVTAALGTGTYHATVADKNGELKETNKIVITSTEDKAVITSLSIEDDYTDGTDISYAATDDNAVVTFAMKKNYNGTAYIFEKGTKSFAASASKASFTTSIVAPSMASTDTAVKPTKGKSVLTTDAASNFTVLKKNPGSALGYVGNDGSVTYKWNATGLTRGKEYIVVFDQLSTTDDNLGMSKENVSSMAAAVPYVVAPSKIAITKLSNNAPVEVTFYTGSGDAVMNFAGLSAAVDGPKTLGVSSGSIYSATTTGKAVKDATNRGADLNQKDSLRNGLWTTNVVATNADAFWFVNLKFEKGVYGDKEVEIRSADKQIAQDVASNVSISYDKNSAKNLKVSLNNLRNAATVYVMALNDKKGTGKATNAATKSDESSADAFQRFYKDNSVALKSVNVEAGTESYTFENVLTGVTTGDGVKNIASAGPKAGNDYIAIVVPQDQVNYSPIVSAKYAKVEAVVASYKVAGTGKITSANAFASHDALATYAGVASFDAKTDSALVAYDQFGNEINKTFDEVFKSTKLDCDTPTKCPKRDSDPVKAAVTAASHPSCSTYGIVKISFGTGVAATEGETWSIKLATGQFLVVKANNSADDSNDAEWVISLK